MNTHFSEKGYYIIKNGISLNTVKKFQQSIVNFIYNKNYTSKQKNNYYLFCKKIENIKDNQFDYFKKIYEYLIYKNFFELILLDKKLYNNITNLLGKDLAFQDDPSYLFLNTPDKDTSSKNYSFKNWHQEIWSGASINSINIWTPLFQKNNKYGQIEIIEESHKWGHVPHKNRSPIELPKKYKVKKLNLSYGDVVVFSPLILHRTVKAKTTRLATAFQIKNFKFKDETFQNKNWKIFSYSEMSKIERILGNHYLSPFRTIDLKTNNIQGVLKKYKD